MLKVLDCKKEEEEAQAGSPAGMFKRSSSFWKVAATTSSAQASESCNKTSS
jgi:hypothetical protein